jgi:hypothetical protein
VAAAGAALLPLALHQAGNDRANFIRETSLGTRIVQVPKQYLTGFDAPLEALWTIAAVALAAYGLWLLARRGDARERRGARMAARIALPALGVPLLLALAGADYFITRNLIGAWVPLMIVVAAGLGVRASRRGGAVATAALCALMLAVVVGVDTSPAYQRTDWRGAAHALGPPPVPARVLVITPSPGADALGLYMRGLTPMQPGFIRTREIAVVAAAERRDGRSPAPVRPVPVRPPPLGFAPGKVTLGKTYTIVRYVSGDPLGVGIDIYTAGTVQFIPGGADFRVQLPR